MHAFITDFAAEIKETTPICLKNCTFLNAQKINRIAWNFKCRGGSRGRVEGVATPPHPLGSRRTRLTPFSSQK